MARIQSCGALQGGPQGLTSSSLKSSILLPWWILGVECQAKWAGPEARMVTGLRRNEWIIFLDSDIIRYGQHPDLRHAILIADLRLEN